MAKSGTSEHGEKVRCLDCRKVWYRAFLKPRSVKRECCPWCGSNGYTLQVDHPLFAAGRAG